MPGNTGSAESANGQCPVGSESKVVTPGQESSHGRGKQLYVVRSSDADLQANRSVTEPPLPSQARPNGMLDRTIQGQIGRMLRDVFSDVAKEPVPDRFVKLLEALQAREKQP